MRLLSGYFLLILKYVHKVQINFQLVNRIRTIDQLWWILIKQSLIGIYVFLTQHILNTGGIASIKCELPFLEYLYTIQNVDQCQFKEGKFLLCSLSFRFLWSRQLQMSFQPIR
ncbi:unnamed protein product [Paramecium pentaurelia]|uniref:Uncharacterized protein n=1 Tax=Paramecium pentaurelia TaxID=43138 RepID=A0A8S1VBK2_9CILI|nr:unnamed protein product [Paramecium pentaurelia]